MLEVLFSFLSSLRVYFQSSADLQLELIALRHQITVLQRKTPKPRLKPAGRRLWAWLSRFWSRWQSALVIVKPDTVIDWHRRGFRWYSEGLSLLPYRLDVFLYSRSCLWVLGVPVERFLIDNSRHRRNDVIRHIMQSVRCYVALEYGASYEDTPNRLQCYIIPSEALARGKFGMT